VVQASVAAMRSMLIVGRRCEHPLCSHCRHPSALREWVLSAMSGPSLLLRNEAVVSECALAEVAMTIVPRTVYRPGY